jgi:hypothetical protein
MKNNSSSFLKKQRRRRRKRKERERGQKKEEEYSSHHIINIRTLSILQYVGCCDPYKGIKIIMSSSLLLFFSKIKIIIKNEEVPRRSCLINQRNLLSFCINYIVSLY